MTKNWIDPPGVLTVAQVLEGLNDVGQADDIAAHLSNLGMLGTIGSSCHCPVHTYVTAFVPGLRRLRVDLTVVAWDTRDDKGTCTVPMNVRSFIRHFDTGHYPELIDYRSAS